MLRLFGIALAIGVMVTAMPAQSALVEAPVDDDPMVFWLKSDGSTGASRLSDYAEVGLDAVQSCGGTAPLENTCILHDTTTLPYGGSWSVGFYEPSTPLLPGGALVGSTIVNLTGSKYLDFNTWSLVDAPYSFYWGCNWVLVNVFGVLIGDANCDYVVQPTAYPAGDLTATFHAGAYQGGLPASYGGWQGFGVVPDGNGFEAGVGTWAGILEAS